MEQTRPDYEYDDFKEMFKQALGSIIARQGIQMASDGHFDSAANNAGGVARAAARYLLKERQRHAAVIPVLVPAIDPPKTTKGVKA